MPWCPKCKLKYRDGFDTCYRCQVQLVPELNKAPDDGIRNRIGKSFNFTESDKWARSTLHPPFKEEDLVMVYTVGETMFGSRVRDRMWLHDILDDNNIPYVIDVVGDWASRKKYSEQQHIFVEKKYAQKAINFIREYNNPSNIIWDDAETKPIAKKSADADNKKEPDKNKEPDGKTEPDSKTELDGKKEPDGKTEPDK